MMQEDKMLLKSLRRKLFFHIFILCALLLAGAYLYGRYVEPKLLILNETTLSLPPSAQDLSGLKVGVFSDTHLGFYYTPEQLEKAVKKINGQEYDILIFLGDLIDNYQDYIKDDPNGETHRAAIVAALSKTKAKYGKFAIFGNHDLGAMGQWDYPKIMTEAGFTVLQNSHETITVAGHRVNMIGLDDWMLGEQDPAPAFEGLVAADLQILIAHEPDVIDEIQSDIPIHLFIAGHSHGGQVRLPFDQKLITPPYAKHYIRGWYHKEQETPIFVTTGIGSTQVPIRFLNVPEIVTISLQ